VTGDSGRIFHPDDAPQGRLLTTGTVILTHDLTVALQADAA
jgi:hypothetical protein